MQRHWGEEDWADRTDPHTRENYAPRFRALSADMPGRVVLRADYLVERNGVREPHGRIYFELYETDEECAVFFRYGDRTQFIRVEGRIVPEADVDYEDHFGQLVDEALAHGLRGIIRAIRAALPCEE